MTETKIEIIKAYNPYTDKYEDLVCKFETHYDKKGTVDDANVLSICSEGGVNLMDFLDPDKIPAEVVENYLEGLK